MRWALKENLQRILAAECGARVFSPGQRQGFALAYPNSYHVGMSNLGLHILYREINDRGDTACERFFLPDKSEIKEYARTNTPLMSIENQRPLYEFPLIGFAVSFEMDYFHLLDMLALGKVELLAEQRRDQDPIVIAGGPCATFNPEPLSDFVDVFVIGEGEEVIQSLLNCYYEGKAQNLDRRALLRRLAEVPGLYVPLFYRPLYGADGALTGIEALDGAPPIVRRQWIADLDRYAAETAVFTEHTEFRGMYLVEISRGCGRHCRFCMAGYCFRRPRTRSLAALTDALDRAKARSGKVGLMGAAISDYPAIDALCDRILALGLRMSVASFRADSVTEDFVRALAGSGAKSLTLAPEAGSERLRRVVNKGITAEDLARAVDLGVRAGVMNFRLYIMIGLPFETPADIVVIVAMAKEIKRQMESLGSHGTLTLSINPFIPKPMTPFQWLPMAQVKTVEESLKTIKDGLRGCRGIELLMESTKEAYLQGILARGDRRVGRALYEAHRQGGAKAFKRALRDSGLEEAFYLYRSRPAAEVFPWDMLDMGLESGYLYREMESAARGAATRACFDGCRRCGVCK